MLLRKVRCNSITQAYMQICWKSTSAVHVDIPKPNYPNKLGGLCPRAEDDITWDSSSVCQTPAGLNQWIGSTTHNNTRLSVSLSECDVQQNFAAFFLLRKQPISWI